MQEKSNKGLIWLIVILIILVVGLMSFILYKEFYTDNKIKLDNTTTTTTNTTNTTTTKKVIDNSKYDEVSSFDLTFNNKEHKIAYKFNIVKDDEFNKNLTAEEISYAKENGEYVYRTVKVSIFVDDNFVKEIPIYYDVNDDVEQAKKEIRFLNKDNVMILKGTDNKDYLVFLIKEEHPMLDGKTNPIIVNEIGKILYEFDYQLGGSKWIEDPNSKLYCKSNSAGELSYLFAGEREFLIESDKIYFIDYPENGVDYENIQWQENILTINNNQVNIKKGNLYKGNGAGAE